MKLSELIKKLQKIEKKHGGDKECCLNLYDAEYGDWENHPIREVYLGKAAEVHDLIIIDI